MTDNELLLAISDLMEKKLESKLEPIKNDIKELKTSVKNLEIRMDRLESRMDSLEARMDSFESEMESRMTSLENRMTRLEKRVTKLELHIENTTDKNIQLLVENYMPAAKKYETETAKIGSMQMDIEIMKDVIREHSERFELIS